jgi:hypothetical protein
MPELLTMHLNEAMKQLWALLVGAPMAVLLLLLLIILGTASVLARNGQALLPREKRWKGARRISPAAITLIGACYLTAGFFNLMTTPELP